MRLRRDERRFVRLDVHADVDLTDTITVEVRIGDAGTWQPWPWDGAADPSEFPDPRTGLPRTGWTRTARTLLAGPAFTAPEGDPYTATVVPDGLHPVLFRLAGLGAERPVEKAPEKIEVW